MFLLLSLLLENCEKGVDAYSLHDEINKQMYCVTGKCVYPRAIPF